MTVSEWWQALILPNRWSVCGISVNALSVWHLYALQQTGNAFVVGGKPTMDDVASLLIITRTNYTTGRSLFIDAKRVKRQTAKMFKALRGYDTETATATAWDYFQTCTETPQRWVEDGKGKGIAAPLCRHLVLCLTSQYGFDHAAAWDYSYSDARCMFETWREREGDTMLVSERERELIAEANRIKEQAATTT